MEPIGEEGGILTDSDSEISCVLECEVDMENPVSQEEPGIVEPYRFEPYLEEEEEHVSDEGSSSESDNMDAHSNQDGPTQDDLGRLENTYWCSCGFCQQMLTVKESLCCQEVEKIMIRKNKQPGIDCITQHSSFPAVCLDLDVLETAYYHYRQTYGPIPVGNDWKRYTAYRQFVQWCFHYLGRKIRVPIPSCAVNRIRSTFPSDSYVGFQNAPAND